MKRPGASLTQIGGFAVVAILVVLFVTNILPMLKAGPDARETLFQQALFSATKHERDAKLHRMAMIRQWGSKNLVDTKSQPSRVVMQPSNKAAVSRKAHSAYVAAHERSRLLPAMTGVRVAQQSHRRLSGMKGRTVSTVATVSAPPRLPAMGPASKIGATEVTKPVRDEWTPPQMKGTAVSAPISVSAPMPVVSAMAQQRSRPIQVASNGANAVPSRAGATMAKAANLSAARCALQRFHSVVVGPEVRLTLRVGSAQQYTVGCPSTAQHQMIVQKDGDALDFGVDCDGDTDKEVTVQVVNGVLYIRGSGKQDVVTTTPTLDSLEVTGDSIVNCAGVSDKDFKLVASGHSSVDVDGKAKHFQLDLSGNSALRGSNLAVEQMKAGLSGKSSMDLGGDFGHLVLKAEADSSFRARGHADRLDLTGSTGSSVDCSGLLAKDVAADAMLGVAMRVYATQSLNASANSDSRIQYLGKPKTVAARPDLSSRIYY